MSIFGIAKKGFGMLKGVKKPSGQKAINSVKPRVNKDSAHKIELKKIPGRVQRIHAPMLESSDKTLASWRQVNQKLSGEKKTKSGISKGKDLKK